MMLVILDFKRYILSFVIRPTVLDETFTIDGFVIISRLNRNTKIVKWKISTNGVSALNDWLKTGR